MKDQAQISFPQGAAAPGQENILKTRALMALMQHFPKRARSPEEQAIWLRDYLADLDCCSVSEVDRACTAWRQSEEGSFPKVGQLLAYIGKFKPTEFERAIPWNPAPESEFDAMPLSEQIRQHKLLSDRAKMKAGPMWKNGRQAGPEELGPDWHRWKAVAKNHDAEVDRLGDILRKAREGGYAQTNSPAS